MRSARLARAAESGQTKPLLWLDHFAYSGRLLAGGAVPWLEAAPFLAYYRQAHSLLKPGVAMLPLQEVLEAWLIAHPELTGAMAGKRRVDFALKTLLAANGPRALLAEIVGAVREGCASTPFVVVIPSPRRWLAWAHACANGSANPSDADEDDIESAAMYVADFLRTFAECRVDGLLLVEPPGHGPASADEVSWYQPVINVARHYRWDIGIESPGVAAVPASEHGIDFWIGAAEVSGQVTGAVLGAAFWAGEPAPRLKERGLYFARVPAGAEPEHVLARLATLR